MTIEIRLLEAGDEAVLTDVAPDVFDEAVQPALAAEFLADPRHHVAVARDRGSVVGFATGVHYVHPDKPPELWVNEVGVAPTHRGRGLATQLLRAWPRPTSTLGPCCVVPVVRLRRHEKMRPGGSIWKASSGGMKGAKHSKATEVLLDGPRAWSAKP